MADYDFSVLSPSDFEDLCRDLLQHHLGVDLQAFTKGRDGGIDLRHAPVPNKNWIVQCKHFAASTFSTLKSKLKNDELPKLNRLNPDRYILATSMGLTPQRVDELHQLLQPHCKSPHDIVSKDGLNGMLRDYPDVERAHFKLWVTSESVLSRILHNDLFMQSAMTENEIRHRLGLYVHSKAFDLAHDKLEKERVCILSGVPGVGKTTLAEMLLVKHMANDWAIVPIHQNVSEGLRAYQENPNSKQVFYYDDFLGQVSSGEKLAKNEDRVLVQLMKSVASAPQKRFILTTREYILAQAKSQHEQLTRANIDIYRFIVECENYSDFEKAHILANHLFFFDVPQSHIESLIDQYRYRQIITHPNYNPRIIERMTGSSETSLCEPDEYPTVFVERLDNPTELWSHAFNKQLSQAPRHLLLTLATCGDAVYLDEFQAIFEEFHSMRAKSLGLALGTKDFRDALNELEGDFIRIHADQNRRVIQFHNPSIIDFIRNELQERHQDLGDLLKTATSFDQVKRIALVFDMGKSKSLSSILDDSEATLLADALRRTINQRTIGVSLAERTKRNWRRNWSSSYDRLRDCIHVANRYDHQSIGDCVARLITKQFNDFGDAWDEIGELVEVLDDVAMATWFSHDEKHRLQSKMKQYLVENAEGCDGPLYGLTPVASWIKGNAPLFSVDERRACVDGLAKAVSKLAQSDAREYDYNNLEGSLEAVQEISQLLDREFADEERILSKALSECERPADDETPDDWQMNKAVESSHTSIESLFDSLLQ